VIAVGGNLVRQTYDVALADLTFDADSQLGRIVAAYRRWQGRTP